MHLACFIVRIYHDAKSPERQTAGTEIEIRKSPQKWKFRAPRLIIVIESRRMKWAVSVECMGEGGGKVLYTKLFGKLERNNRLET